MSEGRTRERGRGREEVREGGREGGREEVQEGGREGEVRRQLMRLAPVRVLI